MTDKQIIIDGVDVSGCKWFCKWNSKCSLFDCPYGGHPQCDNSELYDCDHKQLKRKEQECEELKKEREKKRDHYFIISNENSRLEDEKARLGYGLNCKIEKLKQALKEIKEIAKNGCYDDCGMPLDELSIILQKISEAEDDKAD